MTQEKNLEASERERERETWYKLVKLGANGWPFNTHLFVTTLFMILDLAIKKNS